jgi:L,D-transpeptidase ErfK/SrfK
MRAKVERRARDHYPLSHALGRRPRLSQTDASFLMKSYPGISRRRLRRRLSALCAAVGLFGLLALPAVAADEEPEKRPPRQVVTHFFVGDTGKIAGQQTVVGTSQGYKVRSGDTFLDIAREHDLGYNELVEANPDTDPWVPGVGDEILLPTEWVLPRGAKEGLVLNIPEMRFYYYIPSPRADGKSSMVITYPVGLGRQDWQTPQARFRIRGKTKNPAWVIPESIKAERFADDGSTDSVIPGGHPDNPLGEYRLELTLPSYAIHGTNKTWGIGMQVSHGCVRMYPEDIEAFFPLVQIGTAGHFTYQPVKLGIRRGRVMVEVHEDIYGVAPWPWMLAKELVEEMEVERYVDNERLEAAVAAASGVPTDVSHVDWPVPEKRPTIDFDDQGNPKRPYPDDETSASGAGVTSASRG